MVGTSVHGTGVLSRTCCAHMRVQGTGVIWGVHMHGVCAVYAGVAWEPASMHSGAFADVVRGAGMGHPGTCVAWQCMRDSAALNLISAQ